MAENTIYESISRNILKWIMGVIAGLLVAALYGGFSFYTEWKADEAAEDALKTVDKAVMFDSPAQKEEFKDHVEEAPSALEQRLKMKSDEDFQKQVLQELREMRHMDTLNADQIYQIKEELNHR